MLPLVIEDYLFASSRKLRAASQRMADIVDVVPLTLRSVTREAIRMGFEPEAAFRGLGFVSSDLDNEHFRLSSGPCMIALKRLLRLLDRPTLGLDLGARATVASLGMPGLALMLARTSRDLLQMVIEFQRGAGRLLFLRGEERNKAYCLIAEPINGDRQLNEFLLDETFASLVTLGRQIVGPQFHPRQVELMGDRPTHGAAYEKVFRCPVYFRRDQNRLHFPEDDYVIPSGDPVLLREARHYLEQTHPNDAGPGTQLEASVLQSIRRDIANPVSFTKIAASLHITERTLRRRLGQLGLSYAGMLDCERKAQTLMLLTHSSRSLRDIAGCCGFADERTLTRAVKRWTGQSPTALRKQAIGRRQRMHK